MIFLNILKSLLMWFVRLLFKEYGFTLALTYEILHLKYYYKYFKNPNIEVDGNITLTKAVTLSGTIYGVFSIDSTFCSYNFNLLLSPHMLWILCTKIQFIFYAVYSFLVTSFLIKVHNRN